MEIAWEGNCRLAWHIGTACGPMGLRVSIVNDIY